MTYRSCVVTVLAASFAGAGSFALAGQAGKVDLSKAVLRTPEKLNETAPDAYKAKFDTSKGIFVIEVHRAWAPKGADRFYNLVKHGFYDDSRFFRVIPNFMVQFGINGDPSVQSKWLNANLTDDPVKESNKPGYVSFATAGANTRTTQVFINYADNARLDRQGFSPFGQVVSGMDVVQKLNSEYGEKPNAGNSYLMQGNAYIMKGFPNLDSIKKATIEK